LDRLEVAYTRFESPSRQQAVVETLLPLGELTSPKSEAGGDATVEYDFLPSAAEVIAELLPASFKNRLYKCFLDAAVSEQIARMVAMKAATENAEAMINTLSLAYNRARQGQITSEILEVVGGAEALNG
jgi:F-type H+-transporting ATPase subunit gamma